MIVKTRVLCLVLVFASIGILVPILGTVEGHEDNSTQLQDFNLPVGYLADSVLTPTLRGPMNIAINSSDEIIVTDEVAENIFQVNPGGSVTEYTDSVSGHHRGIAFDASDNLYVADGGGILWKITPDGTATPLASGVGHMNIDVAPSGDIFAVGPESNEVQRINQAGQVSVYANGFTGTHNVAVSPITGEVFVKEKAGPIMRANSDGTSTLLTDAVMEEGNFAFGPDGTLYNVGFDGISIVSTLDGAVTLLPWTEPGAGVICTNPQSAMAVDSQGRLIISSAPANQVVRFDLVLETAEVIYLGLGNTRTLGVAPNNSGVFVGLDNPLCNGNGQIIRLLDNNSFDIIVDDLPPVLSAITFDDDGLGYVSSGSGIYTFSQAGITDTLTTYPYGTSSLAVHPQTGELWGAGGDDLWYLDSSDVLHTIPYPFFTRDEFITFTPDGDLYFYANTSDVMVAPVQQGLYYFDPSDSSFTQIIDLSTLNICCVIGAIDTGQDGFIYWVGYSDRYTTSNIAEAHMLRLSPSGEVTLFAEHLPLDPAAIAGDPSTNDLYFSSAGGIYRVFEAELIFIPAVFRDGN